MKIYDRRIEESVEQDSLPWFKARLGVITGSMVGSLMGKCRGTKRWTDTAITYMLRLASQRGIKPEIKEDMSMFGKFAQYVEDRQLKSKAVEEGKNKESDARDSAEVWIKEFHGNVYIKEVGSIIHDTIPYRDSPDGVVVNDEDDIVACCELKCPQDVNFMRYKVFVRENRNKDAGKALKKINKDYYYQCQAHMDLTETDVCYFAFYSNVVEDCFNIVRIRRNQKDIDEMHKTILEADEIIEGGCESLYVEED